MNDDKHDTIITRKWNLLCVMMKWNLICQRSWDEMDELFKVDPHFSPYYVDKLLEDIL